MINNNETVFNIILLSFNHILERLGSRPMCIVYSLWMHCEYRSLLRQQQWPIGILDKLTQRMKFVSNRWHRMKLIAIALCLCLARMSTAYTITAYMAYGKHMWCGHFSYGLLKKQSTENWIVLLILRAPEYNHVQNTLFKFPTSLLHIAIFKIRIMYNVQRIAVSSEQIEIDYRKMIVMWKLELDEWWMVLI